MANTYEIIKALKEDDLELFINNTNEDVDFTNANISIKILNTDVYQKGGGPDDQIYENGITLLHAAAFYNAFDCFNYIYRTKKVPLDIVSVNSLLPLHYACWTGSSEIALYILTKDPAEATYIAQGTTVQLLYCAIMGGDAEILQTLISNGANLTSQANDPNRLLKKAIQLHKSQIFQVIRDNTPKDQPSGSQLQNQAAKSISEFNLEAFKSFYKGKQDIVFRNQEGNQDNLVRLICQSDLKKKFKNELLEILKDAEDLDLNDLKTGEGLVHYACEYLDLDVAKKMISMPFFEINKIDLKKQSGPFRLIGRKGKEPFEMLTLLIDNGFQVNCECSNSPSLLDFFTRSCNKDYDSVELLLQNNADMLAPCGIKRKNVTTIYDYVMNSKDKKMKELFEKYHKK